MSRFEKYMYIQTDADRVRLHLIEFSLFCIARYHKLQFYLKGFDFLYTCDFPDNQKSTGQMAKKMLKCVKYVYVTVQAR